jgi:hypothetical protein
MNSFVIRLLATIAVTLVLGSSGPALAAPKKPKPGKTPVPPPTVTATDQLESARTATRNLPALEIEAIFRRGDFELRLKARRVGVDWEVKLGGKQPLWQVHKSGNYYVSTDEGRTWRASKSDDDFVTAVMAPLENGQLVGNPPRKPTYEFLVADAENGAPLQHLRLVPEKGDEVDPNGLPEEWLIGDSKGGWLVRRTKSTLTLFKNLVYADVRYEALPEGAKVDGPEDDSPKPASAEPSLPSSAAPTGTAPAKP